VEKLSKLEVTFEKLAFVLFRVTQTKTKGFSERRHLNGRIYLNISRDIFSHGNDFAIVINTSWQEFDGGRVG
jgi:hypothetical protein